MPTFSCSMIVRAPRAWLFDLMQDYDRRLDWDAFLSEARLLDAPAAGMGVHAWCVDHQGRGMETVYVAYRPPERVAIKMTRGPWMFGAFAGSWLYDELAAEETRITFKYHVEARWRAGGRILAWAFERQMAQRIEVLRERMESLYRDR